MNLASQSVLEGLNACFDHRGEVSAGFIIHCSLSNNLCFFQDLYSRVGYDISGEDQHKIICMPEPTIPGQW